MNQTIQNSLNETLDYTFASGIDAEKKDGWIVVLGHGVTGNKERPDDVVLPKDTETVQSLKGDAVKVVFVDGADHSFNEPAQKARMTQTVVEWLSGQVIDPSE